MNNLLVFFMPGFGLAFMLKRMIPHQYLYFLVEWPGTVLHELLHFVVGYITNGKPTQFRVTPKKMADGYWSLGSVQFANITWYNGVFIGLAPLNIFVFLYLLMPTSAAISGALFQFWLLVGLFAPSGIPSGIDLKVATQSLYPVFFLFGLLMFFYFNHSFAATSKWSILKGV